MSEERDTLLAKAADGSLEGEEVTRWEALCAEDPELQSEANDLARTIAVVRGITAGAEKEAGEPDFSPEIRNRLETARRETFAAEDDGKVVSFFSRFGGGGGALLAAAAAVALLAAGWWIWKDGVSSPTVIATVKSLEVDEDLPIATPGETTRLLDPPITWMTLAPDPVELSVWTPDGKTRLYAAPAQRAALPWDQLRSVDGSGAPSLLEPGGTYLFRLQQGDRRTERLVTVSGEAKPLSAWAAGTPAEGRELAESWLASGEAADALALAGELAARHESVGEDFSELRTRALTAALTDDPEE